MLHQTFPIIIAWLLSAPRTNASVCLAPASTQLASANNATASEAVTELFKSYLTRTDDIGIGDDTHRELG